MGKTPPVFLYQLPFRKHTDEEISGAQSAVASLMNHDYLDRVALEKSNDLIWKSTMPQAMETIGRIRNGGYRIGDTEYHGCLGEGEGEHIRIFEGDEIGRVTLWEQGGFLSHPVSVRLGYESRQQIDSAFGLHKFLEREGISHVLYPLPKELIGRLETAENEVENITHIMGLMTA